MTAPSAPDHDSAAIYAEVRTLLQTATPANVDRAVTLLEPLARAGHVDAQVDLGFLLASGQAQVRDLAGAAGWFAQAAEAGSAQAQFNYGLLLRSGQGVPADPDRAAEMFTRAARQGSPDAAFNLAQLRREQGASDARLLEAVALLEATADAEGGGKCAYAAGLAAGEGWCGEADWQRAVGFFEKAVSAGHASAAFNLGLVLYYGQGGVPADRERSRALFEFAAEAGHDKARQALLDPSWNQA